MHNIVTLCIQGGVFLWEEGLPAPRIEAPGGSVLTRERHPSIHDETLEVCVGVWGGPLIGEKMTMQVNGCPVHC